MTSSLKDWGRSISKWELIKKQKRCLHCLCFRLYLKPWNNYLLAFIRVSVSFIELDVYFKELIDVAYRKTGT